MLRVLLPITCSDLFSTLSKWANSTTNNKNGKSVAGYTTKFPSAVDVHRLPITDSEEVRDTIRKYHPFQSFQERAI